jgi:hypothetical protein
MIHVPSVIKIGSGILKLMAGWGEEVTHREHGNLIGLLSFVQNKERRLKIIIFLLVPYECETS